MNDKTKRLKSSNFLIEFKLHSVQTIYKHYHSIMYFRHTLGCPLIEKRVINFVGALNLNLKLGSKSKILSINRSISHESSTCQTVWKFFDMYANFWQIFVFPWIWMSTWEQLSTLVTHEYDFFLSS